MAKRTPPKSKQASKGKQVSKKVWTAEDILDLWKKESKKGLNGKEFSKEVHDEFEPQLLESIEKRLTLGPFGQNDAKMTAELARALGVICDLVTENKKVEKEVDKDTFQKVFALIKDSPKCPTGGGGGEWCDING